MAHNPHEASANQLGPELEASSVTPEWIETKERKTARTRRLRKARQKKEAAAAREQLHETLGEALAESLIRYLAAKPAVEVQPIERAMAMFGYSDELKRLLVKSIELNPAMEASLLKIAELAYSDGADNAPGDDYDSYY